MHAGCIQFIQVDMRVFLMKMYQEAATFPPWQLFTRGKEVFFLIMSYLKICYVYSILFSSRL
jgi:hypothetical protein